MAKGSRRKRRDQWGSIREVERGKRYIIRYWGSTDDRGYRRCCETVWGTRSDAELRRAELMLLHSKDAPCPTVDEAYNRWYLPAQTKALADGDLVEKTVIMNKSNYRRHIQPSWGKTPVDQIKPLDVQKWLNGLGFNQARTAMPVLRKIMTYAVRYGYVDANPMNEDYDMPSKSTITRRDDGIWTVETLPDVWRVFWDSWLEPSVILQGFGSCRFGESLAVKGSDVMDLSTDGVVVAGAIIDSQVDNRRTDIERTKTKQSVRVAVVAGYPAIRLLRLARENSGYLTHDGFGGIVSQSTARRAFASTLEESDVECHLIKNLRKSWQTIARWQLKIPPQYTEPMMGHVGSDVTSQHYDRPDASMFAEVLADHYRENPFADCLDWQLATGYDWSWE